MELQGKKATHDFLSLYTKSSTYQHEDSTPPAAAPPPQGFFLKTQDFLRPLERPAENGGPRGGETTVAAAARVDIAVGGPAGRRGPAAVEHMLPGGIGTYSISHVPVEPPGGGRAAAPAAVVKPEQRSSSGSGGGGSVGVVRGAFAGVPECGKPDPGYGHRSGYGSPYAPAGVEASPCAAWEEKDPAVGLRGGHAQQQRWSSLFAAGPAAAAASRYHAAPENRRCMEAATSRSSKGFDEEEDEDEERGRRDGSTSRKDLSIKVDGKGSGSDQRPNTPRSKHSATEQRRRSKINDRFQILRELIPHSDQKRDKASFLLEVIEYIRFLQERVQKYESSFPEWNQDTSKLMPWVKVYFRSFWKNARNNSQAHVDSLTDPSQVVKNGSASPYIFSGRFDESSIPVAPAMISSANNPSETDISSGAVYKSMENAPGFTSADNIASQDQSQWLRSSGPDCAVSNQIVSEQEELAIDEGTISVSAAYSQGLLSTLMQALQSSGIDLSQATVSVQINLGKRAMNKRNPAAVTPSNNKDADPAQVARFRASGEESSQAHKRQRVDNS